MLAGACALGLIAAAAASQALAGPMAPPVSDWRPLMASDAPAGAGAPAGAPTGTWGFDAAGIDRSVKPGDSFFDFANGAWIAKTEIPADKASYGVSTMVYDLTQAQLRNLIEGAAGKHAAVTTDAGKIGALYAAFMDEDRIEKLDAAPIKSDLDAISAISDKAQLAHFMGRTNGGLGSSFFGSAIIEDAKDPTHYTLYAFTGGLSLPNRDYYLTAPFADKKAKFHDYVAQMLTMIGWPDAAKRADEIVAMETAIAEASWPLSEVRDRDKTYNPMKPSELGGYAPGFDWAGYYQAAGLGAPDRVILFQNTAFPKLAKIYADTPLETLKAWEAFRVADEAAPFLSKRFVDAQFAFRSTALRGIAQIRPRWKRGVEYVDGTLGEVVGKEYVAAYFPPSSKAAISDLVGQLRTALHGRIERLDWMSPETRAKALYKLDKFGVKVGYPNKWRDYSALKVDATDLIGDVRRAGEFEWNYRLAKLGKVVDREEWGMTPQTVNAYYNPTRNEIVFPAAILQAPFFNPKADIAVNYGGIGGVIGHEMTHGFDDQGRKSDGDGVLKDWWTADDAAKFKVQAAKYGAQFDTYSVAPGVNVKGSQTMGENIGDLGGVLVAFDAYHAALKGRTAPVIDGFTGDQRFFLGYAQSWRSKFKPDLLKQQVAADVHSPNRFRVDGPLRNVDAWYNAWGVKEGDKLYLKPEDRVRIW
jgi:putative endopeptidase